MGQRSQASRPDSVHSPLPAAAAVGTGRNLAFAAALVYRPRFPAHGHPWRRERGRFDNPVLKGMT